MWVRNSRKRPALVPRVGALEVCALDLDQRNLSFTCQIGRAFREMAAASPKDFLVIHPSDHLSAIDELDESQFPSVSSQTGTAH